MNADIANNIKYCTTYLDFLQTHPKGRFIHIEIPGKPWDIIGADMFSLYNKHYLCIVDYHSKFPVIKRQEVSADSLILACNVIFSEYGLPRRILSDVRSNFVSERFNEFFRNLNTEQAVSRSIRQVEECIKLIIMTFMTHLPSLKIRSTLFGPNIPNPATPLFNCPIWDIMPVINRAPINANNNDDYYDALVGRKNG